MRAKTKWFTGLLCLGIIVVGMVKGMAADSNFVSADNPNILVEGRYVATGTGSIRTAFPGVALHCRLHGDTLVMRLKADSDEEFFDVIVDGGKPVRLQTVAGEHDYTLFQAKAAADHVVEISRRTESWQGAYEVMGFDAGAGGRLLVPQPLPDRKLLFIGDSITCGAMADYDTNDPVRTRHNTQWCDADATFCKALARHFQAQCELASYGGRGLTRDWQGLSTVANAPQFYERVFPDDPKSHWEPARYVPDGVFICIGGNDFHQGVPDEAVFVKAYVQFVQEIERDAPKAQIFLVSCPMFRDEPGTLPKRTILDDYLREVVKSLNNPQARFVWIHYYKGNPVDNHPTRADHAAIARELEPVLSEALDWN